jgi:energy-coupling factor transporter ATP-binding protein EcfA2
VAVQGKNGSGKTTLLKILGGLVRPTQGKITLLGKAGPTLESLLGRVGFLFQNPDEQLFARTVEEEVAFGLSRLGKKAAPESYLRFAGLDVLRQRHPQTISRGQRQILAVVSVMAMEPEVLILDEPTTGLDSGNWHSLFSLLYDYADWGGTVIFSTHNRSAASAAGRRVAISDGRIVSDEVSG